MTSPKDQSNPPQPAPPSKDQELIQLRREKDALSQIIWTLVQQTHPETHAAEIPAAVSDPLWALVFTTGSKDGSVRILAGSNPPITEAQKKKVVRLLRGTSKPMTEALGELGLEFPASYVETAIKEHLAWNPGKAVGDHPINEIEIEKPQWVSVRQPGVGESVKNFLHIPKA